MSVHPYQGLPPGAFWKSAVAERHIADWQDLWQPLPLPADTRIATAGSCFAQYLGHHLASRGARFLDCEPAPPFLAQDPAAARRFGFGVFSCRTGTITTARQLRQLTEEAFGQRTPADPVWPRDGRWFDALRPTIDPAGRASPEQVMAERQDHLAAWRTMLRDLDVLVLTLGLTEAWEDREDGTIYPTAPGTIAGSYDPIRHRFRNFRYTEVYDDLTAFWTRLRTGNPTARMLLTVSPVPLVATASGGHVLPATIYSKSTLRAVAGDLAADYDDIHYFPSYELIASPPSRAALYNADLRTVNHWGVELVMRQFFGAAQEGFVPICDEERLAE